MMSCDLPFKSSVCQIVILLSFVAFRGRLGYRLQAAHHVEAGSSQQNVSLRGKTLDADCFSAKVLVYNVEKDGREEKGQKGIKSAASFVVEALTEQGVGFVSVPEASFEILRHLWSNLDSEQQRTIGVLYEVIYSEWSVPNSNVAAKADLGLAILYRKDSWSLEKRSKCSSDADKAKDYMPYSGTEEPHFQQWVTESCLHAADGEHLTLSLNAPPIRPMIAARFAVSAGSTSLEKILVTAIHAGHGTHMVGKSGLPSDADQIAKGLATVHDGSTSAYWIFGDMNTHFGLHEHQTIMEQGLLELLGGKRNRSMDGMTFDIEGLGKKINDGVNVSYKLADTLPENVEEPATCCCPPKLPWKRHPELISTGCAGSSTALQVEWTPETDWRKLFKASDDRCKKAQEERLPDMESNGATLHRCMPSNPVSVKEGINESIIFDVEGVSTLKQFALDHVLVGVPDGYKLQTKEYGMINIPFRASDHFPLLSSFEICNVVTSTSEVPTSTSAEPTSTSVELTSSTTALAVAEDTQGHMNSKAPSWKDGVILWNAFFLILCVVDWSC